MKKISWQLVLTMTAVTMLMSACIAPGQFRPSTSISKDCPNGSAKVMIQYSDSYLKVTPRAHLERKSALKFVLKPKKGKSVDKDGNVKDNNDLKVTITGTKYIKGKNASGNESLTWLNKPDESAGPRGEKEVIACTKPDQAGGTYYYSVEVENVGTLDPRVDVEQ